MEGRGVYILAKAGGIYILARGEHSAQLKALGRCEHSALSTAKHDRWGAVSLGGNSQNMSDRYQPFRSWSRMRRWAEGELSARGNPQNTTPAHVCFYFNLIQQSAKKIFKNVILLILSFRSQKNRHFLGLKIKRN